MEQYFKNQLDNLGNYIQSSSKDFFINVGKNIANFIFESSDTICPIVCLLAIAFYVGGSKKAGKIVSATFVFYFLACALRRFVK